MFRFTALASNLIIALKDKQHGLTTIFIFIHTSTTYVERI